MARLTRLQVIQEGLRTAQRAADDAEVLPLAAGWLQRWLDSVAASWPWPMLRKEANDVAVPTSPVVVGGGSGGVTNLILRILDNVWLYTAAKDTQQRIAIKPDTSAPLPAMSGTTYQGLPRAVRLRETSFGVWSLEFDPPPDRPYLMSLSYVELPAAMSQDSDVPWYPNDETLVQAVAYKTHEYVDGKDASLTVAAQQQLVSLLGNDKLRYANQHGANSVLRLSDTVFRNARSPFR